MQPIYSKTVGRLAVAVYDTRAQMGEAAAQLGVARAKEVIARRGEVNIVFAAAPSQFELYEALLASDLDFSRVRAFHMDEYIGLPDDAPQRFGNLLQSRLFSRAPFGRVHLIGGAGDSTQARCTAYAGLLAQYPPDIVFHGIGENGHLAFNDPPVAMFDDPQQVKVVAMDLTCRTQQVHDGCFPTLDAVPKQAITLTIPQLTLPDTYIVVTVPGPTKTEAVRCMLTEPIATACPASCLRRHPQATLVLDRAAALAILPAGTPEQATN